MSAEALEELEASRSTSASSPSSSGATPSYLHWASSLNALLDDFDGVGLFKSFLERQGCLSLFHFHFAHKALKSYHDRLAETPSGEIAEELRCNIKKLSIDMNRSFLRSTNHKYYIPPGLAIATSIREEVNRTVRERTSQLPSLPGLFKEALAAVTVVLASQHLAFLQDDIYIQYIQSQQLETATVSRSDPSSPQPHSETAMQPPPLPPRLPHSLHASHHSSLPATAKRRGKTKLDWRLLESTASARSAGLAATSSPSHPYHASCVKRHPVSAQDSELASMSSDADSFTLPSHHHHQHHHHHQPHQQHSRSAQASSSQASKRLQRQQSSRNHEPQASERFTAREPPRASEEGKSVCRHESAEGREEFASLLSARLEETLRTKDDDAASSGDAAKRLPHQASDDSRKVLDSHVLHMRWDDSRKATPTALRSPGPLFPYPQPAPGPNFRNTMPSSSSAAAGALRPVTGASPKSPERRRPPPLPSAMSASMPSPFQHPAASAPTSANSSLIRPTSKGAKASPASPATHQRRKQPPTAASALFPASDTSGVSSGSSSNPSVVSAARPSPSQGRAASLLHLVYYLPEEGVPYQVTLPPASLPFTLKDIKSRLPKRIQDSREFKYWFKVQDREAPEGLWVALEADSANVPLWAADRIQAKITPQ